MKKSVLIYFFSLLALQACSQNTEQSAEVLQHLKYLSADALEGRGFGTEGNKKGREYLVDQFRKTGIDPAFDGSYMQKFEHTLEASRAKRLFPGTKSDTSLAGANIAGIVKGESEKIFIITAHHDHLGKIGDDIYNGADDNASGTAALIAIAKYFTDKKPKHTLVIAAVDAEEVGSPGCEYLFQNFPLNRADIVLNINMDMISHNFNNEMHASGTSHYPQLKAPLEGISSAITLKFGHDKAGVKNEDDWTYSSDHRIFHKRNIPFIYFGVEDHPDYHQPSDTYENINPEFYLNAVDFVIKAIEAYDEQLD